MGRYGRGASISQQFDQMQWVIAICDRPAVSGEHAQEFLASRASGSGGFWALSTLDHVYIGAAAKDERRNVKGKEAGCDGSQVPKAVHPKSRTNF